MGPNSLDALCKRYGIDIAKRSKHGALLDSELLASVYLELIGGRQIALTLPKTDNVRQLQVNSVLPQTKRTRALPERITREEKERHEAMVKSLGAAALWKST
jgi:DNA polymerase-3 subunit epsilon